MSSFSKPKTNASDTQPSFLNETSIPFQHGISLGQPFDVTKQHDPACKPLICPDGVKPKEERVNRTTAQFSIVKSVTDVCDILQLPLEYVLKVKANWIQDDVVAACVRGADNPNTFCIIFRIHYLEQQQYLPETVKLNLEALLQTRVGDQTKAASDADSLPATPCVRAIEFGNELIVICGISVSDKDEVSSLIEEMTEDLDIDDGLLGNQQIKNLDKFAKKWDKKLTKKRDREIMKLEIEYCTYSNLQQCPATLTDMVNVIKEFLKQCEAWTDLYKHTGPRHYDDKLMMRKSGAQKKGTLDNMKEADRLHHMRAIIQSLESAGNKMGSFRRMQYPETGPSKLRRLNEIHLSNTQAIETLQEFMASDFFISEDNRRRGDRKLEELQKNQTNIVETIKRLDFETTPTDEELKSLSESISTASVAEFIKTVQTLPPGPDLDLILIGKTGLGKSSTGNSILRRKGKFKASGSPTSVTEKSAHGWAKVDERVIKVVDTPGVCDTKFEHDEQSIELGTRSFNEAIVMCPEGFHALVIVLQYGIRCTKEEKGAIEILKAIFGKDIIKNNCVCVLTHGDNFDREEGHKTFYEWCKKESADLKDIFEECQYRCVLFDNQSEDSKVCQRQLVELVYHVDKLNTDGKRYTNKYFDLASKEREKVIEEKNAPEMKENVMREAQLIANELDDITDGKYNDKTHTERLNILLNLKISADKLKIQLDGSEKMSANMNFLSSKIDKALDIYVKDMSAWEELFPILKSARGTLSGFYFPFAVLKSVVSTVGLTVVAAAKGVYQIGSTVAGALFN